MHVRYKGSGAVEKISPAKSLPDNAEAVLASELDIEVTYNGPTRLSPRWAKILCVMVIGLGKEVEPESVNEVISLKSPSGTCRH